MSLTATHRVAPCPRVGCTDKAWFAYPADIARAAHIWTCRVGLHGPRILGYEAGYR